MKINYASLGERTIAFVFDYVLISLYLVATALVGLAANAVFPNSLQTLFGNSISGQITSFLIITLPVVLYFALLESSQSQATWGKRKKQIKVISRNGERLSRTHAIIRTMLKFIPWELAHTCIWQIRFAPQEVTPLITAGLILVWVLIGANLVSLWISPTRQTLYDRVAGTYVING